MISPAPCPVSTGGRARGHLACPPHPGNRYVRTFKTETQYDLEFKNHWKRRISSTAARGRALPPAHAASGLTSLLGLKGAFSEKCADRSSPLRDYIIREALPCRALVERSALALSRWAASRLVLAGAPLSRKWPMKSFRPSLSRPSFGLSLTLRGAQKRASARSQPPPARDPREPPTGRRD